MATRCRCWSTCSRPANISARIIYHAGGVPAVVGELMKQGLIHEDALTVNGKTIGDNCRDATIEDEKVIRPFDTPLKEAAPASGAEGQSVRQRDHEDQRDLAEFRDRYLSNPTIPKPSRAGGRVRRAGGLSPPHRRSGARHRRAHHPVHARRRPDRLSGRCRGREHAPARLSDPQGIHALPCIGDGRQSGTSGSPSILNASPEAAAGGGLALLRTGDRVRIDLRKGTADMLIGDEELAERRAALMPRAAMPILHRRRPGRRSSALSSARWTPARCSKAGESNTSASPRPGHPARQPLIATTWSRR
jgi:dihydroxy-acid dehydratase